MILNTKLLYIKNKYIIYLVFVTNITFCYSKSVWNQRKILKKFKTLRWTLKSYLIFNNPLASNFALSLICTVSILKFGF